jgi:hypothetical protein
MELAAAERCLINQHKYFSLANIGLSLKPYAEDRLFHYQLFCLISTMSNNPDYTAVLTERELNPRGIGGKNSLPAPPPRFQPPSRGIIP